MLGSRVDASENRQICRDLDVMALPSYVLFRDGTEVERLTGAPSKQAIEQAVERLLRNGGEGMNCVARR